MSTAPDITPEIRFQTARSGGKGGQNVNKVESMVEGYFHIADSPRLTDAQKTLLALRLAARINSEGFLLVKSQTHRSQLENKAEVVKKIRALIALALKPVKKRLRTRPTAAAKEKRLDTKKKAGEIKEGRRKFRYDG